MPFISTYEPVSWRRDAPPSAAKGAKPLVVAASVDALRSPASVKRFAPVPRNAAEPAIVSARDFALSTPVNRNDPSRRTMRFCFVLSTYIVLVSMPPEMPS